MVDDLTGKLVLTDAVIASVIKSGAAAKLKDVSHTTLAQQHLRLNNGFSNNAASNDQVSISGHASPQHDLQLLKKDALQMIEAIQQLLNGSVLDAAAAQKLDGALNKLRGVVQGSHLSSNALANALAEAAVVFNEASGNSGAVPTVSTAQQYPKIHALIKQNDELDKGIQNDLLLYMTKDERAQRLALLAQKKKAEDDGALYLANSIDKKINMLDETILNRINPANAVPGEIVSPQQKRDHSDASKKHEQRRKMTRELMIFSEVWVLPVRSEAFSAINTVRV